MRSEEEPRAQVYINGEHFPFATDCSPNRIYPSSKYLESFWTLKNKIAKNSGYVELNVLDSGTLRIYPKGIPVFVQGYQVEEDDYCVLQPDDRVNLISATGPELFYGFDADGDGHDQDDQEVFELRLGDKEIKLTGRTEAPLVIGKKIRAFVYLKDGKVRIRPTDQKFVVLMDGEQPYTIHPNERMILWPGDQIALFDESTSLSANLEVQSRYETDKDGLAVVSLHERLAAIDSSSKKLPRLKECFSEKLWTSIETKLDHSRNEEHSIKDLSIFARCPKCLRLYYSSIDVCPEDGREVEYFEQSHPYSNSVLMSENQSPGARYLVGDAYLEEPNAVAVLGAYEAVHLGSREKVVIELFDEKDPMSRMTYGEIAQEMIEINHPNILPVVDIGYIPVPSKEIYSSYKIFRVFPGFKAISLYDFIQAEGPIDIKTSLKLMLYIVSLLGDDKFMQKTGRILSPNQIWIVSFANDEYRLVVDLIEIDRLAKYYPGPIRMPFHVNNSTLSQHTIFNLGGILYELLMQKQPYSFKDMFSLHSGELAAPSVVVDLPEAVEKFLLYLLEVYDPKYKSLDDVKAEVKKLLEE